MGASLFGAGVFNLDEALLYWSFSHKMWSVPRSLYSVDLNLFWPGKGPISVGVTPRYWYLRTSTSCLSLSIGSLESDWTH